MKKIEYIQVQTTFPNAMEASRVSKLLVKEKLAGCVQVIPGVSSHYDWQGALDEALEVLVLIKTHQSLFGAVSELIQREHSYDTPELIATPIVEIGDDYAKWLKEVVSAP